MIPILPRDFLWTDKETMDEIYRLEPINEDFFEVFEEFWNDPIFDSKGDLRIFNEVYYQATRLVFEKPNCEELKDYIADAKANLGSNSGAMLVMTMVYYLLLLLDNDEERRMIAVHTKPLRNWCLSSPYWKPFKHCFERLRKENRNVTYSFEPTPLPAEEIYWKYLINSELTQGYDMEAIGLIIGLWKDKYQRAVIARKILDSMAVNLYSMVDIAKRKQLENYVKECVNSIKRKNKAAKSATNKETEIKSIDTDKLAKENEVLRRANADLMKRLQLMVSESESRVDSPTNDSASKDSERAFTLKHIVDYCKNCVEWSDAKAVVAMLNKMLRHVGTQEESTLVDSIEEHFRNIHHGNTYNAPVGQVLQHVEKVENKK